MVSDVPLMYGIVAVVVGVELAFVSVVHLLTYTKTKLTNFTTRTLPYSLPEKLKKMENFFS